jgi:chromosome segregation ATPase
MTPSTPADVSPERSPSTTRSGFPGWVLVLFGGLLAGIFVVAGATLYLVNRIDDRNAQIEQTAKTAKATKTLLNIVAVRQFKSKDVPAKVEAAAEKTQALLTDTQDTIDATNKAIAATNQTLNATNQTLDETNALLDQAKAAATHAQESTAKLQARLGNLQQSQQQLSQSLDQELAKIQASLAAIDTRLTALGSTGQARNR